MSNNNDFYTRYIGAEGPPDEAGDQPALGDYGAGASSGAALEDSPRLGDEQDAPRQPWTAAPRHGADQGSTPMPPPRTPPFAERGTAGRARWTATPHTGTEPGSAAAPPPSATPPLGAAQQTSQPSTDSEAPPADEQGTEQPSWTAPPGPTAEDDTAGPPPTGAAAAAPEQTTSAAWPGATADDGNAAQPPAAQRGLSGFAASGPRPPGGLDQPPGARGGPPVLDAYWPDTGGRHGHGEPSQSPTPADDRWAPRGGEPARGDARGDGPVKGYNNSSNNSSAVRGAAHAAPQPSATPQRDEPAPPLTGAQVSEPTTPPTGSQALRAPAAPDRFRAAPPPASTRAGGAVGAADYGYERSDRGQPPPPPTPRAPGHPMGAGLARQGSESVGPLRATIRPDHLVRPYKPVPETGWRKALYKLTRINLGLSPSERAWNDLRRRITTNLRGTYLIAVMQQKGGVSKTTVTIGLGEALSRYRDDKIVAIDANPASGNLARRVDEQSTGTWRGLIADPHLAAYADFRFYLAKDSSSGLEVLAGDPGDEVLTGGNLAEVWQRLQRQYPIGLVDCGTQLRDDVTAAVLNSVDAVVVPSTTRLDGALAAEDTLNWLAEHGYPHLVRSAVMLISDVNKLTPDKSVRNLHDQFEKAVRAVHYVPFDPHLSDAVAVDFDRLKPAARRAFIEAAASVVDGFPGAADRDAGAAGHGRSAGGRRW